MHKRKMARHAISQLFYLQIVMLIVDSEYESTYGRIMLLTTVE